VVSVLKRASCSIRELGNGNSCANGMAQTGQNVFLPDVFYDGSAPCNAMPRARPIRDSMVPQPYS
jgi:hypothetical protein